MQAIYDLARKRRKQAGWTLIAMRDSEQPPIDWNALFPTVLHHLFDEPERKLDKIWCYGSEGSLVAHVGHGTWYDHLAGVGGDPLALVKHVLRRDDMYVRWWLKDQGLIDRPPA